MVTSGHEFYSPHTRRNRGALGATEAEVERQALEGLVLESFRAARLSKDELAQVLGLEGGDQIDGFLKAREVYEEYTIEEINHQVETLARLGF